MKSFIFIFIFSFFPFSAMLSQAQTGSSKKYTVAAYYCPVWHPDSINNIWHGKDWTEWDLLKAAKPKFPGHEQPVIPSWGYFNDADPEWAAKQIDLAADHGIDVFIFDWYWYAKTGRYMHGALENGFLKAPNRNRMKFALMWANHDWVNQMPATLEPTRVNLAPGGVSMSLWDTMSTYIVDKYFTQPNYWKIDGKPYFCIYEINNFINGLGGMDSTKKALQMLEDKAKKIGLPGIHLSAMDWNLNQDLLNLIKGPNPPKSPQEFIKTLNFESITPYNWEYAYWPEMYKDGKIPQPYSGIVSFSPKVWRDMANKFPGISYAPNVGTGFDPTPRTIATERYEIRAYPYTPVLVGNTPELFKKALIEAREFIDESNPKYKIIALYAWNEWTEGGYLLPDKRYGTGYLDAVKEVFGKK